MGVLDLIFPKVCLECKLPGQYLCPNCLKKVRKGYVYTESVSFWRYEGVIRKAILALKYRFTTDIAKELSSLASNRIEREYSLLNGVLVPIPLSPDRLKWRGFNQAEELGKRIAKSRKWGFEQDLLIKTKNTGVQAELHKSERLTNLQGAFSVKKGVNVPKDVILFDDVRTTGSTLSEAKKELLRAGAVKVIFLTLACS
jgi:competence protein ComFC